MGWLRAACGPSQWPFYGQTPSRVRLGLGSAPSDSSPRPVNGYHSTAASEVLDGLSPIVNPRGSIARLRRWDRRLWACEGADDSFTLYGSIEALEHADLQHHLLGR